MAILEKQVEGHKQRKMFLAGVQNGTTTLENTLAVSYKVKYTHTIQLSNPILGKRPREMKLLFTQKPICKCL